MRRDAYAKRFGGWHEGDGPAAFFRHLREEKVLVGALCSECGAVVVPPHSWCDLCGGEMEELREVGPRGVVLGCLPMPEGAEDAPVEGAFRYVLVRLAGADTSLLYIAPDDNRVLPGASVVPEYREPRIGGITDIIWFVPEV